ncbi:MAG TPA: tetratricopeptide repeat protein [Spirochaetia bacterium]|nr:tetratricopeptide repeat protein [Spirochaetia bacterium]
MPDGQWNSREGIGRIYELLRAGHSAAAIDAVRGERHNNPESIYLMAVEADVLWRAGQTAAAEALLGEIFARDPGNKKALVVKTDILLQKDEAEEALTTLRTHPDQAAPYVARRLVTIHFRLKQYRESLAVAQRVLQSPEEDPKDAAWFKGMAARCLEKMGDTGQAVEFWQDSGTREARMKVIRLKMQAMEPALAFRELQQMARLQRYDQDAEFHALWAEQLAAASRPGEAADHWQRAAALRPGHSYYVKRLAYELKKAGRLEDAMTRFQEAVLLDPGDRWLHEALYRLFAAGRQAQGCLFLQEVLRRHPDAGWAHGHLKKLANLTAAKELFNGQDT